METEIKVLDIDRAATCKLLEQLGAKKIFDGQLYAELFDTDDRRFEDEKKCLRLRREGEVTKLTYKELLCDQDAKQCEEIEVVIDNPEELKKILSNMGYKLKLDAQKYRISYLFRGARFDIDTLANKKIPTYLEIEAEDAQSCLKFAKLLGFTPEQCKPWTTKQLLDHYN